MSKIAFVFPGQGSQKVGMGHDVYEQHEQGREVFMQADRALGEPLSELIFTGPESELKLTYHTQPALLTTSIALLTVFREQGIKPDFVAGHSLGEYSALVAAGVMSFADAVRTVKARGEFMEAAVPSGEGAMAAVLGAEQEVLQQCCEEITAAGEVVQLANLNCPGQIVISGTAAGVQQVVERGKAIGARRVIPLEVSGPFHSSLMKPAAEQLAAVLAEVEMNEPQIPVVANVTARQVTDATHIRQLLAEQVYSPVQWTDSIEWMIGEGVNTFFEIGSGQVLTGLIKKIDRTVNVYNINSMDAIKEGFDV